MEICIDCEHESGLWCIKQKDKVSVNVVTGVETANLLTCSRQRIGGWLVCRIRGLCGKEGRWFEPKKEEVTV